MRIGADRDGQEHCGASAAGQSAAPCAMPMPRSLPLLKRCSGLSVGRSSTDGAHFAFLQRQWARVLLAWP